jgi:SAM-dependent methyltransferase
MSGSVDADRFREFERSAHDRIADSYHAFFVPITEHAAEPLLDAAGVQKDTKMLDVASGSGIVAAHAARRKASATGVDLSPRMVTLAATLHPTCTFRQADVESLPFADRSFDAIVCAFGLGHFPSAERAVAECVRVLAPKGKLAFAWWDIPARNRFQGVLLESIQEAGATAPPDLPAGPPMFRFSEDAELRGLLAHAHLEEVTVLSHSFSYRVPSTAALWDGAMGSLARTSALLRGQTAEMQSRIRSIFDRLASVYAVTGGIDLPMAFKIVSGRRSSVT